MKNKDARFRYLHKTPNELLQELNLSLRRYKLLRYLDYSTMVQLEEVCGVSRYTVWKFLTGKNLSDRAIQKLLKFAPSHCTKEGLLKAVRRCEVIIKEYKEE